MRELALTQRRRDAEEHKTVAAFLCVSASLRHV
jgi:hypothetical protein